MLAALLFVTFLQVPAAKLVRSLRSGRFLAAALVVNFVVVPAVVAAMFTFLPGDRAVRLGMLLVLLAPRVDDVIVFSRLAGLHPAVRWDGDSLHVDTGLSFVVRPGGRGLTLLSSALWTGRPLFSSHPDGSTLVVHPSLVPLPLVAAPTGDTGLADLLGRTRAAVLTLATTGRTTGELARDLGISAASVSENTGTLRCRAAGQPAARQGRGAYRDLVGRPAAC